MLRFLPEPEESGGFGAPDSAGDRPEEDVFGPGEVPRETVAGFRRRSVIRVGLLLAGLVLVTAIGIEAGRRLAPGSKGETAAPIVSSTTPSTPSTTATTATTSSTAGHAARSSGWGPLPVRVTGRFTPGGARAGATLTGKTLVVAGGDGSARVLAGRVSGQLTRVAALPGPRSAPQVFTIGGTVYVIGGEDGSTPSDAILRIDLASHQAAPAGTFVEPLAEAGVAAQGGSAYLVGGWTGSKYATAVLRFTPPSSVALVARLPAGLRSPAVLLLRDTLYVAGGRTDAGLSRKVYAVDVSSGAVTALGDLPQAVEQAVLVAHGTKLYLLGGKSLAGKPSKLIVKIDPATGQPTAAGSMPQPLAGAAAVPTPTGAVVVDPPLGRVYRVG